MGHLGAWKEGRGGWKYEGGERRRGGSGADERGEGTKYEGEEGGRGRREIKYECWELRMGEEGWEGRGMGNGAGREQI